MPHQTSPLSLPAAMQRTREIYDETMAQLISDIQIGTSHTSLLISIPSALILDDVTMHSHHPSPQLTPHQGPSTSSAPSAPIGRQTVIYFWFDDIADLPSTTITITVSLPVDNPIQLGAVLDATEALVNSGSEHELQPYLQAVLNEPIHYVVTTIATLELDRKNEATLIGEASKIRNLRTFGLHPAAGPEVERTLLSLGLAHIWVGDESGEEMVLADANLYILGFARKEVKMVCNISRTR
jgi:hypothetical protein